MTPIAVSVVVPVYCSAKTLPVLHERLTRVLGATGRNYELIFVDDGSKDDSWAVLSRIRDADPTRVMAIQLMRNFGQHNALMAGFRHARGAIVVTLDDDLQNPPEEIPKLLNALETGGYDLVYGNYVSKKHNRFRNFGSWLALRFFQRIFRVNITPTAFRAIRAELVQGILAYRLNFTVIDGLCAWSTQRIGSVLVEHHERSEGRSGYSFGKLLLQAVNLFTNFSLLPLQAVTLLGFFVASGGLLTAVYYFIRYLMSEISVPGYASTIIAILTLGGVQLISLGIIGEYLGRVLLSINQKPQYVERQILSPRQEMSTPGTPDRTESTHQPN